jgi:hypothetical protein
LVDDAPVADRLPLTAVATIELPQPLRFTTRMLNDRLDAPPALSGPCEQVCPSLVGEHDQDDEPTSPSREMPDGSVMVTVSGPVAALPGSDTLTVTSAVTPRLSTPLTWTDTLSLAVPETVGVGFGVGLGDGDAEVPGEPGGVDLGEEPPAVAGADAASVGEGAP